VVIDAMAARPASLRGEDWFVVLPDVTGLLAAAPAVVGVSIVARPSGQPWLIGSWTGPVWVAVAEGPAVALVGTTALDDERLGELIRRATTHEAIERALSTVPGAFHAIARSAA